MIPTRKQQKSSDKRKIHFRKETDFLAEISRIESLEGTKAFLTYVLQQPFDGLVSQCSWA